MVSVEQLKTLAKLNRHMYKVVHKKLQKSTYHGSMPNFNDDIALKAVGSVMRKGSFVTQCENAPDNSDAQYLEDNYTSLEKDEQVIRKCARKLGISDQELELPKEEKSLGKSYSLLQPDFTPGQARIYSNMIGPGQMA